MKIHVSATQIAFLTFAVTLLSVPLGSYLITGNIRSPDADKLVLRLIPFGIFATLLAVIRPLRFSATRLLATPIPTRHYSEVFIVALCMIPLAWATTGARALWAFFLAPEALDSMRIDANAESDAAFSPRGMVTFLALGVLVAPVLEELLFRGFLLRAGTRDWGWIRATLVTSTVFGFYHPFLLHAFVFSIVLVCVVRRTGSLWAPICIHAFSNLMAWWPLMGQHIFPDPNLRSGDLSSWSFNLAALAIAVIAVPTYVWMSRDRDVVAPTQFLEPNAPLPK